MGKKKKITLPETYEGKPFASNMQDIKLDCILYKSTHHSVQDLWKDDKGNYFAFYHTTGLQKITKEIYDNLKDKYGIPW